MMANLRRHWTPRAQCLSGLGLAAIVVVSILLRLLQGPAARPDPEAEFVLPTTDEAITFTVCDTVRRGDTFSAVLLRNRVSVQEIGRILEENRRLQLFSPRSLQPGQVLTLTRDEYGRLSRLRFEVSPEEIFVFEDQGGTLAAYPEDIDRELRLRKLEGEIHSTFDEAVLAAGGDYRLSLRMADLFAYDVDFCTEVHKGDAFELLVEERFANGRFLGFGEVLYGRFEGKEADAEAIYFRPEGAKKGAHYDRHGEGLRKAFLKSPLNYRRISSNFAAKRFHPILKTWRPHHGVDYAAAAGTPVVAVADGSVEQCGWRGGYGRVVRLQHAGKTETLYGHLSRFAQGLRSGSKVRQGQVIGFVGMSGLATGPHLHYELLQSGARVDPQRIKNVPAEPIDSTERPAFENWIAQLQDLDRALEPGQVIERFDPREVRQALASLSSVDRLPKNALSP